MTENVSLTSARLPKYAKQANSADLIRHRNYDRCVVCEDRKALGTNILMMPRMREETQQVTQVAAEAVATKWWTCKKCEEGS